MPVAVAFDMMMETERNITLMRYIRSMKSLQMQMNNSLCRGWEVGGPDVLLYLRRLLSASNGTHRKSNRHARFG